MTVFLLYGKTGSGKSLKAIERALGRLYKRVLYVTAMTADAEEKFNLLSRKPGYARKRFGGDIDRFKESEVVGFFGNKTRNPGKLSSNKFFCIATYPKIFPVLLSEECPTFDLIIFDEIDLAGRDPRYEQFVTLCLARNERWGADIIACSAALNVKSLENVARWLGATPEECPGGTDVKIRTRFLDVSDADYNGNRPHFVDKVVRMVHLSHRERTLVFVPSRGLVEKMAKRVADSIPRLPAAEIESIYRDFENLSSTPLSFRKCMEHGVVYEHAYMKPRDRELAREIFNSRLAAFFFATNALERGVNVDAQDVVIVKPDVEFWATNQIINMVGRCDRIQGDDGSKGDMESIHGSVTFLTNGKVYTLDDLIPKDIVSKLDVNDFPIFRHTLDRLGVPTTDLERKTLYHHTVSEHILGSMTLSPNMEDTAFAMGRNFQSHAHVMAKNNVLAQLPLAESEREVESITREYLDIPSSRWGRLCAWDRTRVKYALRFLHDIALSWDTKKLVVKTIFHRVHGERYGDLALDAFLDDTKEEGLDPILKQSYHRYRQFKYGPYSSGDQSIQWHEKEREASRLKHKAVREDITEALKDGRITPFEVLSEYGSSCPPLLVEKAIKDFIEWKAGRHKYGGYLDGYFK